jgi:hypothetical protein
MNIQFYNKSHEKTVGYKFPYSHSRPLDVHTNLHKHWTDSISKQISDTPEILYQTFDELEGDRIQKLHDHHEIKLLNEIASGSALKEKPKKILSKIIPKKRDKSTSKRVSRRK